MNDSQKLLKAMLGDRGYETLEKAIYKQRTQAVIDPLEYYLPLIVVPRTIISWLIQTIKPMRPGEIKDVKFPGRDDISIHFEKQDIDQYRAEFVSGGRVIHTFEKQSLPAASAHLMTVGELYDEFADKKPEVAKVYDHEKALEISEERHKEEAPRPEFGALQHMISMANVKSASDPEQVKWEMSHANVRELTAVIGKLVDSLTARHMFGKKLEDELDKVSEKEVKGDPQKRENSQTPEEKNKADIKATAANPAIKDKPEGILAVRDLKAKDTQDLQIDPKPKEVPAGKEAQSGDPDKEKPFKKDSLHEASMQASKNIASPRMAGAQNDQDKQRGIEQRMNPMSTGKGYFRKKHEILTKPYVSDAQRRWAHTAEGTKALGGKDAVHHWDEETKGKNLPEHTSKCDMPSGKMDTDSAKKIGEAVADKIADSGSVKIKMKKDEKESKQVTSGSSPSGAFSMTNAKKPAGNVMAFPVLAAEKQMDKAEMPKGAGQPKAPQAPQPPKPPVPAGNNPQASASKQAQMSGTGGYKPPQTPGAPRPKNPTMKPKMAKNDYFRSKLGKSMTATATEEMLYKSACPECGTPEFVKAADGKPEFNPCACFRVLKKDEEGRPTKFVHAVHKTDGTYGLEFDENADPEAVKMFLLTLKARLLIKKNHGI